MSICEHVQQEANTKKYENKTYHTIPKQYVHYCQKCPYYENAFFEHKTQQHYCYQKNENNTRQTGA